MTPRRAMVLAMLVGCVLIVVPALSGHGSRFLWNASASLPIGLYRIVPPAPIEVADLVAVLPPDPLASFLAERGYLARNVPLIKRVLAVPGTPVCRHGTTILAYGLAWGEARERDKLGRDLPIWQGCRQLRDGEIFLMNWDASDSFDGRYFGPLPVSSIVARLVPVWTDEDGDGRFQWRADSVSAEP